MFSTPHAARVLTLIAAVAPLAATAAEPLVWKWEEGESQRYKSTQSMQMTINAGPAGKVQTETETTMAMTWSAKEVKPDDAAVLEQQVERVAMSMQGPMGQGMKYDTASDAPPSGMAAMIAPTFEAMVAAPITLTMLPTGEITELSLPEEMTNAMGAMPGGADMNQMVKQSSQQGFVTFPKEPLEVGQSWTRQATASTPQMGELVTTTTYTYNGPKEVDGKQLESIGVTLDLDSGKNGGQGQMQMDFNTVSSDGEILFDRESGKIVSSRLDAENEITMTMGAQSMTNSMTQQVRLDAIGADEEVDFGAGDEQQEQEQAQQPAPAGTGDQ
ncbi:DUF6263 family protein [Botrimarina sp.]|uniref:DUF6263 family protein n=1 Tax=Botrimarina sp. TaxID=2795802 RepID=UPI0032EE4639